MAHLRPHRERREGARERQVPEFVLLLWSRVGPRVSQAHCVLVNLKHKTGNLMLRRKKKKEQIEAQIGQLLTPAKITKTKEPGDEGNSLALYLVCGWQCVYLRNACLWSRCVFEEDAWQLRPRSGTCITKRENLSVRAFTTAGHILVSNTCITSFCSSQFTYSFSLICKGMGNSYCLRKNYEQNQQWPRIYDGRQ